MFVTLECCFVYYVSPTKSQTRTSGGPLLIVKNLKPKKKFTIRDVIFDSQKKPSIRTAYFISVYYHTFLGPTIRCVPEAPASQVRMSVMLIFVCPPGAKCSKFREN